MMDHPLGTGEHKGDIKTMKNDKCFDMEAESYGGPGDLAPKGSGSVVNPDDITKSSSPESTKGGIPA